MVFQNFTAEKQNRLEDGHWLSPPGKYLSLVERMCSFDPRLRLEDSKAISQGTPLACANGRVVHLGIDKDGKISQQSTYEDSQVLKEFLDFEKKSKSESPQGNIYLVEAMNPKIIDLLGEHFWIHPAFFADHQRFVIIGGRHHRPNDNFVLPSMTSNSSYRTLKYYEVLYFGKPLPSYMVACSVTGRHIGPSRDLSETLKQYGNFTNRLLPVGVVRRKCSIWQRINENKTWDCVILCDPRIDRIAFDYDERVQTIQVETSPYQGGYVDFQPHEKQLKSLKGPPRTSLLDDFCHYWNTLSNDGEQHQPLMLVNTLVQKIITGHYTKLFDFVRSTNGNCQLRLTRRDRLDLDVTQVEQQWSDCQQAEKRVNEYIEDLENIFFSFGIPLQDPDSMPCTYLDTTKDFQFLYFRLKQEQEKARQLNSYLTGLAGIAGNRQASYEQEQNILTTRRSIREAKGAKALTFIGLVFIPLAFTSSLLSMGEQYLPGSDYFWVYFCISIPLSFLVLLSFFVMDKGYNDEAKWSLWQLVS